jgi:hypothetical protein
VREALLKRIGSVDDLEGGEEKPKKKRLGDGDEDGDKDGDRPKKKKSDDDEDKPKKRLVDAGEDKGADEDRPKKSDDDEDKPKKKKKKVATADDDDGEGKPRARKRKRGDSDGDGDGGGDGEGVRDPAARPLPAARVAAGLGYAARYLTYSANAASMNRPPKVFTPAPSFRLEGEVYPLAFMNREGPGAGIAIFGEYDKTLGLSITIPNAMGKSAPISQSHYSIGAGYRLAFGKAAVSVGLAYARRSYIADRSSLTTPMQLDTPDVDYAGISPVVGGRVQVVPKIAAFVGIEAMLVSQAGAITKGENYGKGSAFGIGGHAGVDVALGKQLGLRFAAEYNQISIGFAGTGDLAKARQVTAASDRDFGMSATLAAMY